MDVMDSMIEIQEHNQRYARPSLDKHLSEHDAHELCNLGSFSTSHVASNETLGSSELLRLLGVLASATSPDPQNRIPTADIDAALWYSQAVIDAIPSGHPALPRFRQGSAKLYQLKYHNSGNLEHLNIALGYSQAAVCATPLGALELPAYQRALAALYSERYHKSGNISDLEVALRCDAAAVDGTPLAHPDLPTYLSALGTSYMDKYHRLGNVEDMENSLWHHRASVASTPPGHPSLLRCLRGLAASYSDRYQRLGNIHDLEAAFQCDTATVMSTPAGHPDLPSFQCRLGISYSDKYRTYGSVQDLEAALHYGQAAVDNTVLGDPELASRQHSLAWSYGLKFDRLQNIADLEMLLKYNQLAVKNTPSGHSDLARHLHGLAWAYSDKYHKFCRNEDMEAAIKYHQATVDHTPAGHPSLPGRQGSLALAYSNRYERLNDIEDLNISLAYDQAAVDNTPPGHPDLKGRQRGLAWSYMARFKKVSNDIADLDTALKYGKAVIENTPSTHPELASYQITLAQLYTERYDVAGEVEDLQSASDIYYFALQSDTASPLNLWKVAIGWGALAMEHQLPVLIQAYKAAMSILPDLLWPGSTVGDRHEAIIRNGISNTISSAVAAAIQLRQLDTAVEFLEQGLSTTYKQLFQLKHEPQQLLSKHPDEASEFHRVSSLLRGITSNESVDRSVNYNLLAQERKDIIERIRTYQGFEDFLSPPSYSRLSCVAQNGPVIMLNCSPLGTDAIILLPSVIYPVHIHLPDGSALVVQDYMNKLRLALNSSSITSRENRFGRPYQFDSSASQHVFGSMIHWLWKSVVEPIFHTLAEYGISRGRIWWCPSGPFTYLPIHAAAPLESAFVQSYTPTLSHLIQATERNSLPSSDDILSAVGVTRRPGGWSELPFVQEELGAVANIFGGNAMGLNDKDATISNVFEQMKTSAWLHLACHGHQDVSDPLKSGLILYDGTLELGQILDSDLPLAKFVYLSACETAMGDAQLVNEAMHLTGGFIASGFQGAIGTLWSIADADGLKVAEMVYKTIMGEKNVPDVTLAAQGLHLAIQKLRRDGAPFQQWMPFIHVGV